MVAYVVGIRHKTLDQKDMDAYESPARKSFKGKTVKLLARYGAHEDVESGDVEGMVLLEFPTMKEAQDWYHSPEYAEAKQHRLKGANFTLIIFEGV